MSSTPHTNTIEHGVPMSGLEQLKRTLQDSGGIGPFLGIRVETLEEGHAVFSLTPRADFANPLGTIHGGVLATLLDSAMGCAVHTALPPGHVYTTLELSAKYVRAPRVDDDAITGDGRVVHLGRRIATASATIMSGDGRLIAHGTSTCLIIPIDDRDASTLSVVSASGR